MQKLNDENIQRVDYLKDPDKTRLIVVLEEAFLETVQVGGRYQLLNSDDHYELLLHAHRSPEDARPDILHYAVLSLTDSALNKAGLLQIIIRTRLNQIIYVNPQIKFPRTFRRFAGLFVQLLHKHIIRSPEGVVLLRMVKGPVPRNLPLNCPVISLSRTFDLKEVGYYVQESFNADLHSNKPVAFVIGAMAHGHLDVDYATEKLAISQYALSAASACSRVCAAFEHLWKII